jgi:hypothetical protein
LRSGVDLGSAAGVYSAASATVFITFTVLHNYTTVHEKGFGVGFSGLFQRIAVICGWGWLTALALHLLCQQSAGRPRH